MELARRALMPLQPDADAPPRSARPHLGARRHVACSSLLLAWCTAAVSAQQATKPKASGGAWTCALYSGLSYAYDTNIDHAQPGLQTFGLLAGFGGDCSLRSATAALDISYDGVLRRYAHTDVWNVPGHDVSVLFEGRIAQHWTLGAGMEYAVNGSSEDRVLRDEYSWQPQLEFRLNGSNRLLLYGEYLIKEYPNPLRHHESDPRVGVRFRQQLGQRWSWTVSGRYEYNRADSAPYRYNGPSYGVDLTNPLGAKGRVSSSVRYRERRFTARTVRVGNLDVLRRDTDWVATVAWHQVLGHWEVVYSYRYEKYGSNDTRREFREHLVSMTLNRWW